MRIADWPEDERPRERLLKLGAGALSEAELLAIFLRTGISQLTCSMQNCERLEDVVVPVQRIVELCERMSRSVNFRMKSLGLTYLSCSTRTEEAMP